MHLVRMGRPQDVWLGRCLWQHDVHFASFLDPEEVFLEARPGRCGLDRFDQENHGTPVVDGHSRDSQFLN